MIVNLIGAKFMTIEATIQAQQEAQPSSQLHMEAMKQMFTQQRVTDEEARARERSEADHQTRQMVQDMTEVSSAAMARIIGMKFADIKSSLREQRQQDQTEKRSGYVVFTMS